LHLHKDLPSAALPSQIEQLQSRIAHSEGQINSLVYALYGLTDEEIKIVEL
jgi:hypothetical protein